MGKKKNDEKSISWKKLNKHKIFSKSSFYKTHGAHKCIVEKLYFFFACNQGKFVTKKLVSIKMCAF
jgi:hypothetical protein